MTIGMDIMVLDVTPHLLLLVSYLQ